MPRPAADRALEEALRSAAASGALERGGSILLAVSGGADSLALLHAAADLASEMRWRLAAGHVHHGWRGRDADHDLAFVRDHARRLGIPFLSRRGDARRLAAREGLSPEAGARRLRYAALLDMAAEARAIRIATAHHKDDRLESYLIARERRGGVASLGGPRARRADGVVRPFLSVPREALLAFLRARGLSWRRDATNGDLSLARNRVRRAIAEASAPERAGWEAEAELCSRERDRLDADFDARVAPILRRGPGSVLVDAGALAALGPELGRRAIEAAALAFARPGRPPMTGREREQILARVRGSGDFRFEAGRRIAIERRGGMLAFSLRPGAPESDPVYDFEKPPPGDPPLWAWETSRASETSA